ncbi:MAG: 50S ribosomal protein L32 [Coxiellaceae bacterium]|jgi:large subunit ribosomal protein L32|nr:50S ribosomal protein L32 [Coxiellaceae bacterium]
MAVQKSRVTRSKRGMRRSHNALIKLTLSLESASGETHIRHHLTKNGYYRGRQIITPKLIKKAKSTKEE